jgi:hypothetical protein
MKSINHTPTGLHITYEEEDYLGEQDDRQHRIEQWKQRRNLMRGFAIAFTILLAVLGLIAGGYRLYLALFPPR